MYGAKAKSATSDSRTVASHSFFFQAEDGIRDYKVTGVQTCALPICLSTEERSATCSSSSSRTSCSMEVLRRFASALRARTTRAGTSLIVSVAIAVMLRSEEHTSELQSPCNLVCRLLLEKKMNEGNSF